MFTHLKNFLEGETIWNDRRVIFVDFKRNQEAEFIKQDTNYIIKLTSYNGDLIKNEIVVEKKLFYKKLGNILENTLYNPRHYRFDNYNKYQTLLSLWFNK